MRKKMNQEMRFRCDENRITKKNYLLSVVEKLAGCSPAGYFLQCQQYVDK